MLALPLFQAKRLVLFGQESSGFGPAWVQGLKQTPLLRLGVDAIWSSFSVVVAISLVLWILPIEKGEPEGPKNSMGLHCQQLLQKHHGSGFHEDVSSYPAFLMTYIPLLTSLDLLRGYGKNNRSVEVDRPEVELAEY